MDSSLNDYLTTCAAFLNIGSLPKILLNLSNAFRQVINR